jgi:hypothetical protein
MFKNKNFIKYIMRLVGFSFNKINAEKTSENSKNLKINTGIDISDIREVKSDFFKTKEDLVGITFEYTITYEPGFAKLNFIGNVLMGLESSKSKEVFKKWKDKEIPEDFRLVLFNIILKKSSLRALQLEEELNLPTHFPLPSIKLDKEDSSK